MVVMKKHSAGILLYRHKGNEVEVFIGHHGSPLWSSKDSGAWTVPKGTIDGDETALQAARREFNEETGLAVPDGELFELGDIEQKNNKKVTVWAIEADIDTTNAKSNLFDMEWPPRSGKIQKFPELDRLEWFDIKTAASKINPHQVPFLERLAQKLKLELSAELPSQASLL
jgi:predicted NUDIX family NTP pyrophosphohydrolase